MTTTRIGTLISIDPATHGVGAALWLDGLLYKALYIPNPVDGSDPNAWVALAKEVHIKLGNSCSDLVFEIPQIYQRGSGKSKGDPNKLLPLVGIDGALAYSYAGANIVAIQPHAWKGSTDKPERVDAGEYVITTRVKNRLSTDELARVDWSRSVKHSYDVADAIGVGLFHLGRFERKRVFARE